MAHGMDKDLLKIRDKIYLYKELDKSFANGKLVGRMVSVRVMTSDILKWQ